MKKRFLCFLTVVLIMLQIAMIPAAAEDTLPDGNPPSTSQTDPKPDATQPSDPKPDASQPSDPKPDASEPSEPTPSETTKPTDPVVTDPTQGTTPTEPSESKPCTHVYGEWTADEAAHGRKCTLCGYSESNAHTWAAETITVEPTCAEAGGVCKICTVCQGVLVTSLIAPTGKHTYDNSCDTACNVCKEERTIEHTFGKGWKYSGKGHWHYCTICGAADEVKAHYPGPAATEEKDQICLTCGMVMMKKKPHTHQWDSKWSSDAENHWYTCSVCQEKDRAVPHVYDNGCDTQCNDCSYTRAADHLFGPDMLRTELTHSGICTVCGVETSPEAHVADSSGTNCRICGYAIALPEETHAHTFEKDTWGCDENGHWNLCMCGEKANAEAHMWDEGTEAGKQILYTCEVCGAEKTEEAPEKEIPWILVAMGGIILLCLIGIVVCIVLIRKDRKEYA